MKAIKISNTGGADVLKLSDTEPVPKPGAQEALIKIHSAGVNFVDIYHRRGLYPVKLPFIPGLEASGVVESVGAAVTEFQPGDRVAYTGHLGSYSEYTTINAAQLIKLPESISFIDGAAFPLQGMTAHYLIHDFRSVKRGDFVLIHAAAGGVGGLLVQWARHIGATVIGTAGTGEKAAAAVQAGADHIILYTEKDVAAETMRLTNGHGADLILDGVGKTTFAADMNAVAVRGHVVVYGAASGPADPVAPNNLMAKSFSLSGGSLGNFTATREDLLRRSGDVLNAIRDGWLKLRIDSILPLAEVEKAHRLLEGRSSRGKIVLSVVE